MSVVSVEPKKATLSSSAQLHEKLDSLFTREYRKDFPYRLDILEGQAGQMKRMLYHDANPEAAKIEDRIGMCADLIIQVCMLARSAGLSIPDTFRFSAGEMRMRMMAEPRPISESADPFEFIDSTVDGLLISIREGLPDHLLRGNEESEFRLILSRKLCKAIGDINWVNPKSDEIGEAMVHAFAVIRSLGFASKAVFEHGFERVDQKVYANVPRLKRAEVSDETKSKIPGFITVGLSAIPGRAEGALSVYYKDCPDIPKGEKAILLAEKDDVGRKLQTYVLNNAERICGIIICTSAMNTHTVISVRDHPELHIPIIVQVPEGDFVKLCARANKRVSMTVTKDLSFVAKV